MPEYIDFKVVAFWAAYWVMLFLAITCIMKHLLKVKYMNLQIKITNMQISELGEEPESESTSFIQRVKSAKIFDKMYRRDSSSDPYNNAWEGQPNNTRRKTI